MEGTIEKKERFGYFVALEPGITGLLPRSKIKDFHQPSSIEGLREGDPITVTLEEVRPEERRITLAPGVLGSEGDWHSYSKGGEKGLGSLGEKLQRALDRKKGA